MHICVIAPPFEAHGKWVTVPPAGYGGIQWAMTYHIDGLLELGHEVTILGAPGSVWADRRVTVLPFGRDDEVRSWLEQNVPEVTHDFANFSNFHTSCRRHPTYLRTWHLTSPPPHEGTTIFVSQAQRDSMAGFAQSSSIPIGVRVERYYYSAGKDGYLLFLGRVSNWKGTYEAADFAHRAGRTLVIAGPTWESDYTDRISTDFGSSVKFIGEVGDVRRRTLLSRASAVLVMSQPVPGPWGQIWCEPGATVVSEAAASGTPVIASDNGCLPELAPSVGKIVRSGDAAEPARVLETLPTPAEVRARAERQWGHAYIATRYLAAYASAGPA
jgi:glycosyltransferase involved in cell wall biosynthesis